MSDQSSFNGSFDAAIAGTSVPELIESLVGVTPTLDEHYDLHRLGDGDRLQVRVEKNVAPREYVQRFANQMTLSQFPPIIVTEDDKMVDGNTRRRANIVRETRFFPAWVIPVSYDDSDEEMQDRLVFLGQMLNNRGGKQLDKIERGHMIRRGIALGMSTPQIVGTTGVKQNAVLAIRRELAGEEALRRVGIDPDRLSDGPLATIGQFADLNDEPLRKLAELSADAQMGVREIKGLAVDVKKSGSDEAAVRIVDHAREANATRIRDIRDGRQGKPPAAAGLRRALGFIMARDPDVMVERNPEEMADHLELVIAAITSLTEIMELQQQVIDAQPQPEGATA